MAMEALQENDTGEDGNMQCTSHPYRTHQNPGGICALCLQEKLGKLVSSSFPITIFPSSSSSPSPSFRSEQLQKQQPTNTCTLPVRQNAPTTTNQYYPNHPRRARMPFILAHKKKKKVGVSHSSDLNQASIIELKRSKSTTTLRRGVNFMGLDDGDDEFSPRKRGFWSFLYATKPATSVRKFEKPSREICYSSSIGGSKKKEEFVVVEGNDGSPNQAASFDRKVSRSRSVGCGSRSFSGDFFERISTGFGDCTLRRVESQREGKHKVGNYNNGGGGGKDCMKERVKCGGIFGGFMITSSSSSSSSSSYWVSSSSGEDGNMGGKHLQVHGRSKSWGWAFASPIRAFKPSSSGKREKNNTTTPNLNAIPSLLAVGG